MTPKALNTEDERWWRSLEGVRRRLGRPVPADSVELFRVGYGLMMAWSMLHYVFDGRGERLLWGTIVQFRFPGFEWIPILPDAVLPALCWALLACSLAVALGIWPRVTIGLFALGYGYVLFYDAANYNNHDYLIVVLGFLLAFMPRTGVATLVGGTSARTLPTWCLWLLRFHIALPYFFGGVAKLGYDWIVLREPMTLWFREGRVDGLDRPVEHPEFWGAALSWGGVVFDLAIIPLLLWPRTRLVAYLACVVFHVTNSQLFVIGPFPGLMIVATTLFFRPDWPQKLRLIRPRRPTAPDAPRPVGWVALSLMAGWVVFQLALPFRHFLYPGQVNWTEEGHRFAWRMKLRDKVSTVEFQIRRGNGRWERVEGLAAALTQRQLRMMEHDPEMVLQFARFLQHRLDPMDSSDLQIRATMRTSLNGRPLQDLIDPEVDLLQVTRDTPTFAWLVPLSGDGDSASGR